MKPKVAIPFQHQESLLCEEARKMLLGAGFEIAANEAGRDLDEEEQKALIKDAFAVIAGTEKYDRDMLAGAGNLKAVLRYGVGLDNFDLDAMKEKGIQVGISVNENAVAEFTLTLMLGVIKNLPCYDASVRQGAWNRYPMRELKGKTVGIVGFGRIGRRLAHLLGNFEVSLLAYDPLMDARVARSFQVKPVSFEEILKESDIISLHLPLTPQTKYLINDASIALMKDGVYLINTARGAIVEEEALCRGLESGKIAGAGLDVFETEPVPAGNRLLAFPNVVVSSHAASLSYETNYQAGLTCAESIIRIFHGGKPLYPVI